MSEHQQQQEQADDLPPSLVVLWDVIRNKIYPTVVVAGFGYRFTSIIKHIGFYDFIRIFGFLTKGLLTGEYNTNPNPDFRFYSLEDFGTRRTYGSEEINAYYVKEQKPKLSPRRLAFLTYSGKGLKDIGLDTCAANSIMPMNKPEKKKIQWLSGALISRRVVEV